MLDVRELRKDPKIFEARLKTKIPEADLSLILSLDEKIRALKTEVEELKLKRNQSSKEIGYRKQRGEDISAFMAEMGALGQKISELDERAAKLEEKIHEELAVLPNLPMDDIPVSPSPKDNVLHQNGRRKAGLFLPLQKPRRAERKAPFFRLCPRSENLRFRLASL